MYTFYDIEVGKKEVEAILETGWSGVVERLCQTSQQIMDIVIQLSFADREPNGEDEFEIVSDELGVIDEVCCCILEILVGFLPKGGNVVHVTAPPSINLAPRFENDIGLSEVAHKLDKICRGFLPCLFATQLLSERTSCPMPTLAELAQLHVEIRRLSGIERLLEAVMLSDVTVPTKFEITAYSDLFGVGEPIANFAANVISPWHLPFKRTVTISADPDVDHLIAAYLASSTIFGRFKTMVQNVDETFDPSSTHAENHCSISVGTPLHTPEKLRFDSRQSKIPISNTRLIFDYLTEDGRPMQFIEPLVQRIDDWFSDQKACEVLCMIQAIKQVAETDGLAYAAVASLLHHLFPQDETYYRWKQGRLQEKDTRVPPNSLLSFHG